MIFGRIIELPYIRLQIAEEAFCSSLPSVQFWLLGVKLDPGYKRHGLAWVLIFVWVLNKYNYSSACVGPNILYEKG